MCFGWVVLADFNYRIVLVSSQLAYSGAIFDTGVVLFAFSNVRISHQIDILKRTVRIVIAPVSNGCSIVPPPYQRFAKHGRRNVFCGSLCTEIRCFQSTNPNIAGSVGVLHFFLIYLGRMLQKILILDLIFVIHSTFSRQT